MVIIETLRCQREYFDTPKKEILSSGHRYAVVHSGKVHYYDSEKSLYIAYPSLSPNAGQMFGTYEKSVLKNLAGN